MSWLKTWLVRAGLAGLLAPIYGGHGAILVFHRIRDRDPDWLFEVNHRNSVAPEAFSDLLDALAAERVDVVSLDEAMARLARPRHGRFVCLTFDDGYRDNHDVLLPLATARAVPVTIYVAPGLIDGTAPLWWYAFDTVIARESRLSLPLGAEREWATGTRAEKQAAFDACLGFMLRAGPAESAALLAALAERYGVDFSALAAEHMMDWAGVRRMAASPQVEIGAHTMTHPSLGLLDMEAARRELAASRDKLETAIGAPINHLAYPFGAAPMIGRREVALAAELGFRTAVTAYPGNLFPEHAATPHVLPRHGIGPRDSRAALLLKLAGVRRLGLRDWRPVVRPLADAAG